MQLRYFLFFVPLVAVSCSGSSATSNPPKQGDVHAVTIDHANYRSCESADASGLANAKLFFAHASVGGNILTGLGSLHSQDSVRYPLTVRSVGERPDGDIPGATVSEYDRGNPGAGAKVALFERYVESGWKAPTVNVVLNKFCFIDPDADFGQYTESMERIAASNPDMIVVYATIPLHTEDDDANVQRETFNERLRAFVATKKRFLLDIADIEAHAPDGQLASFQHDGRAYRQLYAGYTTDGGHLNDEGSAAVAKGLVSLLEAAFTKE